MTDVNESIIQTVKRCPSCKEIKQFSEFNKNCRRADGYQTYCRNCQHIQNKNTILNKINKYMRSNKLEEKIIEHNMSDSSKVIIGINNPIINHDNINTNIRSHSIGKINTPTNKQEDIIPSKKIEDLSTEDYLNKYLHTYNQSKSKGDDIDSLMLEHKLQLTILQHIKDTQKR